MDPTQYTTPRSTEWTQDMGRSVPCVILTQLDILICRSFSIAIATWAKEMAVCSCHNLIFTEESVDSDNELCK